MAKKTEFKAFADLSGGIVRIRFKPCEADIMRQVKAIRGRRWNPVGKFWTVPFSVPCMVALACIKGMDFSDALVWSTEELLLHQETNETLSNKSDEAEILLPSDPVVSELMPFQKAGVSYILRNRRVLLADEMGLGKTVQALVAARLSDSFPLLIICPASLKLNWEKEAKAWCPGKKIRILEGTNPKAHKLNADIVIANYDILGRGKKKLVDGRAGVKRIVTVFPVVQNLCNRLWRGIFLDESHYIKATKTKRTQACRELMNVVNPHLRLCLTGTPILSRPVEIYPQLKALGVFESTFGNFMEFGRRYCGPTRSAFGLTYNGATNLGELNQKLRATCMVRRTKEQVLTELPPKRFSSVPMQLTASFLKEYREAERNVVHYLHSARGEEAARAAERAEVIVQIMTLKRLAASGKMESVCAWVEEFLESGEKLVLFGEHREPIEMIYNRFRKGGRAEVIHGGTGMDYRQRAVDLFQDRKSRCRLLVGNIKAMGTGLTLTAASNVAFFEFGWTPGEMDQAEDRCHRIGQSDSVTAWYLIAPGTIDEMIIELIRDKQAVVNKTLDGTAQRQATLRNLIERLTQKIP